MTTNRTSPARKRFCVWADNVRRVYQHVEAESAEQAYQIAMQQPECWEPCDLHESNGYRLSNEVQDLQTDELVDISGPTSKETPLPWRIGLSECDGVYGGEKHWEVLGAQTSGVVADIEGGLTPRAKTNAQFIERACNNFGALLKITQKLLERLNLCCCLHAYDERVIRRAEKIIDNAVGRAA
jgi:hypothetical protein